MKKIYGGYEITKALGYPLMDYCKIMNLLNLLDAPMQVNEKRVNTYCLTEYQIKYLKNALRKLKEYFNGA